MKYVSDKTELKAGDYVLTYGKRTNANVSTVIIGRVSYSGVEIDSQFDEGKTFYDGDIGCCVMYIISTEWEFIREQDEDISILSDDDVYLLDDAEILEYIVIEQI